MSDLIRREAVAEFMFDNRYCTSIDDAMRQLKSVPTAYDAEEVESALKQVEAYNKQYLDDPKNPLEPFKISSALNRQIMVLEYRLKHAPKEVSILDYTIFSALKECLDRRTEVSSE